MSKGNAFNFWQNRVQGESKSSRLARSSSTASEFIHLRKGKKLSSPLSKKEETKKEEPALGKNLTSNITVEEGAKGDVGSDENGSPVLRRSKKVALPPPKTDAAEEEEEELRKFVRKSMRRIKRETRVLSQDFLQSSTIPELEPVEVDEEEVEEMLPLVKDLLAGNQPLAFEDEEEEKHSFEEKEDELKSVPKKVPIISVDYSVEDVQVEKEDNQERAEHDLETLIKELENADDLDPESVKDILKRSLSAFKTMREKMKSLESQLKGGGPSSSPVPVVPSGPPPPPPPAPPPSLLAGPKPLVIKKRQGGNAQAAQIAAGPPQVDMMAEMRKMMARRNERKSLRVKYTHLEK